LGGPIVTEGGVVFIGAAMDNYLRAFDAETGKELWKGRLPAGCQATPMTYRLAENGRQFVVIAAGGHGRLGTDIGDSVVAFALPDSRTGMLAQAAVQALRTLAVASVTFPTLLVMFAAIAIALLLTVARRRSSLANSGARIPDRSDKQPS
jgi:hypothetical protein